MLILLEEFYLIPWHKLFMDFILVQVISIQVNCVRGLSGFSYFMPLLLVYNIRFARWKKPLTRLAGLSFFYSQLWLNILIFFIGGCIDVVSQLLLWWKLLFDSFALRNNSTALGTSLVKISSIRRIVRSLIGLLFLNALVLCLILLCRVWRILARNRILKCASSSSFHQRHVCTF